jgi:hypothetical protein
MADARGEDRSSFQSITSWDANTFAIMKATEGTTYKDPTFASNWANAKFEGKPRAAYHFLHPALSGAAQASFFLNTVKSHGGFQPGDAFMVDAEILSGEDGIERVASARTQLRMHVPLQRLPRPGRMASSVGSVAHTFLSNLQAALPSTVRGLVYTDKAMLEDLGDCTHWALFIAYYSSSPPAGVSPWKSWTFWQKSAGGGYGGGDLDYYNGTNPKAWFGGTTPTPTPGANWTEILVNELPTLQLNSSGADVRTAQGLLEARGYTCAIDGAYGSATQTVVKKLQAAKKLTQDGVVGENTWAALLNR